MSIETSAIITLDDLEISVSRKTVEKRNILNNLKANQTFLRATLSVIGQDLADSDIKSTIERTTVLAAKYCKDIIKAIEQHIRSLPATNINDLGERELAVEAFNHIITLDPISFIEAILSTINDQMTEDHSPSDQIATSVSFHASLLLGDFNDNWLPLETLSARLNQITACVSIIHAATQATSRQEIAQAVGSKEKDNEHAVATDMTETAETVFDTKRPLPSPGAMPKGLDRFIMPTTDAPTTHSTIPVRKDISLLAGVAAISLVGMAIGFARTKSSIDAERRERATTKVAISRASRTSTAPRIVAQPFTLAPEPVEVRPAAPVSITTSSSFAVADLVHSPLEEGVRRALLAQTVALGHCLTDPRDAIYLAYGLRRPITNQLRRTHWQVGNVPSQRGITITWTDNGRCNDFQASGWEINDAGTHTTIYSATRIVIATAIPTITYNQKLYHRLPVVEQR